MIEGKLVRDLIPDIIRESGRPADVRYLSGAELLTALAANFLSRFHSCLIISPS